MASQMFQCGACGLLARDIALLLSHECVGDPSQQYGE